MPRSTASPNVSIALKALDALGARDFDALRALLSPDVRLEWPYHPSGEPVVIESAGALIEATRVVEVFRSLDIRVVDVVEQPSAGRTIIEARSEGTYANGRPSYKNHYLFMLTLKDGKITEWREFYNPLEVMKVTARRARST
jgi:ketosteroid isomerase-like protein